MANNYNLGVDLSTVIAEINANETKIDTVDSVVDAIRATDVPDIRGDIAALPSRAQLKKVFDTTTLADYQTIVDVVGGGKLYNVGVRHESSDTGSVRFTIDGVVYEFIGVGLGSWVFYFDSVEHDVLITEVLETTYDYWRMNILNLEFKMGLKVEHKRDAGGTNKVKVIYGED